MLVAPIRDTASTLAASNFVLKCFTLENKIKNIIFD